MTDAVAKRNVFHSTFLHRANIARANIVRAKLQGEGSDRYRSRRCASKVCLPGIDRQYKGRRGDAARQAKAALE
jgi:hypothetical protein